jgi:hypothetical protein
MDSSLSLLRLTVALSQATPIGGADVIVGENEKWLGTNYLSMSLARNLSLRLARNAQESIKLKRSVLNTIVKSVSVASRQNKLESNWWAGFRIAGSNFR